MINFALNKEKSKTFVKFYEKQENNLRIHYGNNTTHIVPNSEETKTKLNQIMENQLNDQKLYEKMKDNKVNISLYSTCGVYLILSGIGTALIFNATTLPILCYIGAALFAPSGIKSWKLVRDYKKNTSFLKYKKEIQDYLTVDEESLELNQVEKEVFTINDAHFMSCREMKKMTKDIKSILSDMQTSEKRDLDLGIRHEKPTFKQKVKEFKRK